MESLTLVINPGSSSRKYSLYSGSAKLHDAYYETESGAITLITNDSTSMHRYSPGIAHLDDAFEHYMGVVEQKEIIGKNTEIKGVGVRVVAPSSYFLDDHIVDQESLEALRSQASRAPLHINTVLREIEHIATKLPGHSIVMVSDSAFHKTKSDVAWNYALPLEIADRYDLKRFGYHGLSVASTVRTLEIHGYMKARMVICHLGSGASVTALLNGQSIDNSMGYSPLEGLVMATRSGSVDVGVVFELQRILNLDTLQTEEFLNRESGLLGLSGRSSDIRDLLEFEQQGDYRAGLALRSYALSVAKHIASMSTVLGGLDMLVFTGTVGERSGIMRARILENLKFIGLLLDDSKNGATQADKPIQISADTSPATIMVLHADEGSEIAYRVRTFLGLNGDA